MLYVDIGVSDAGSDRGVFEETDLKEAFEEDAAGLHTAQPDNFGGFTEARRQLQQQDDRMKAFIVEVQGSSVFGTSMAPTQWRKFHLALKPSATAFHSTGVTGHFMTSAEYFMMASQTFTMRVQIVSWATLNPYRRDLYLFSVAR